MRVDGRTPVRFLMPPDTRWRAHFPRGLGRTGVQLAQGIRRVQPYLPPLRAICQNCTPIEALSVTARRRAPGLGRPRSEHLKGFTRTPKEEACRLYGKESMRERSKRFVEVFLFLALMVPFEADAQIAAPAPPAPPVTGICGAANGVPTSAAPASALCAIGTASAITGNGPWTWTCGLAACSAPLAASSALCGMANNVATTGPPISGLCSAGTASPVSGTGPWTWSCAGIAGGASVACSAPTNAIDGACGTANNVATTSAPTIGLCSAGTASPVSGTGPWTWICFGSGGGTSMPCGASP